MCRAMAAFCRHPDVATVQPVVNPDDIAVFNEAVSSLKHAPPTNGGATRQQSVHAGLFLERGCPKSLYRPGSSVDVLIFQKDRMIFALDILANMRRRDVSSRFTCNFQTSLVETDVKVRSEIGRKA